MSFTPTNIVVEIDGVPIRCGMADIEFPQLNLQDVCVYLGIDPADAIRMLLDDEFGNDADGQFLLTEVGAYRLGFSVTSAKGKRFVDMLAGVVLPEIRDTAPQDMAPT